MQKILFAKHSKGTIYVASLFHHQCEKKYKLKLLQIKKSCVANFLPNSFVLNSSCSAKKFFCQFLFYENGTEQNRQIYFIRSSINKQCTENNNSKNNYKEENECI